MILMRTGQDSILRLELRVMTIILMKTRIMITWINFWINLKSVMGITKTPTCTTNLWDIKFKMPMTNERVFLTHHSWKDLHRQFLLKSVIWDHWTRPTIIFKGPITMTNKVSVRYFWPLLTITPLTMKWTIKDNQIQIVNPPRKKSWSIWRNFKSKCDEQGKTKELRIQGHYLYMVTKIMPLMIPLRNQFNQELRSMMELKI